MTITGGRERDSNVCIQLVSEHLADKNNAPFLDSITGAGGNEDGTEAGGKLGSEVDVLVSMSQQEKVGPQLLQEGDRGDTIAVRVIFVQLGCGQKVYLSGPDAGQSFTERPRVGTQEQDIERSPAVTCQGLAKSQRFPGAALRRDSSGMIQ